MSLPIIRPILGYFRCPRCNGCLRQICLTAFLLLSTGCGVSTTKLPPLPPHTVLKPEAAVHAINTIERFDQATGLVSIDSTFDLNSDNPAKFEARLGFFINRTGALRLELYPSNGFVSLGSALITDSRITALDRVKRVGLDSEQISNTFVQLTGLSLSPNDLVMALTGRLPADLDESRFLSAGLQDDGSVVLRDRSEQLEIEVLNGEIVGVKRAVGRKGTVVIRRRKHAANAEVIKATADEIAVDGTWTSQTHFSISNRSFTRPIAAKMFELDTSGYQMRRRLN